MADKRLRASEKELDKGAHRSCGEWADRRLARLAESAADRRLREDKETYIETVRG